jgi:hypothetical protein
MRRGFRLAAVLLSCALLLSGCRSPESKVHGQITKDAEEMAIAAADIAHRSGLQDQEAFETSLRSLPETTLRGLRNFRWHNGALLVFVSFSSTVQRTEAEGAGRYSARSCAEFTVDSRSVKLLPADCPEDVPLKYGSNNVTDHRLPEINKRVQSRW